MEILDKFGVEWTLTLAQIINFLVILYVLKRYLYRPIFNMLKKRRDAIKDGLEKAEEGKKELEKALEKEKKIIKDAQETAKTIIQDARDKALENAKEIEEKAKQQADRMISDAKGQIDIEIKDAEKILNKYVADMSIKLLKKSLPNALSEKEQEQIVTKTVKEFKTKTK